MKRSPRYREYQRPIPAWKFKLLGILIISAVLLYLLPKWGGVFWGYSRDEESISQIELIEKGIEEVLEDFGIQKDWIEEKENEKRIRVPSDLPLILPYLEIIHQVERLDGVVLSCQEDMRSGQVVLEIGHKDKVIEKLTLIPDREIKRIGGKIAIIIDDFGYTDGETVNGFLNLPQEVTVSIIPGLNKSNRIAQKANRKNKEVMIHLPMEPLNGEVEDNGFVLLTELSTQEIRYRVRKAIREIPYSKGLNNHMGSKATLDERVMGILMEELKKAGYYFVDSRTNTASIAYKVAQKMGLSCGKNATFLDIEINGDYIREKLKRLVGIASREKKAIGIAHARRTTLKIFQEELAKLEKRGFKLVPVSEVVQ